MEDAFISIGLSEKLIADFVKNEAKSEALMRIIEEAGVEGGCPSEIGMLLLLALAEKLNINAISRSTGLLCLSGLLLGTFAGFSDLLSVCM